MVGRTLPEALRRGLTFWRRSIQARVVVSTVLLSAIVVTAVGWFLLRQVEQGLVDRRVDAVLTEVASENAQAQKRLEGAPATETDGVRQSGDFFIGINQSGQVRGFHVVMTGHGVEATLTRDIASVPDSLARHFDDVPAGDVDATAWTFTTLHGSSASGSVDA